MSANRIELSINVNYLPEWGLWHGVRELISNGRDAEVELHAPLMITHEDLTLTIENHGATLTKEALLFGTLSKQNRTDTIGRFGEGLALSCMALVRLGHDVVIRTGNEVWTAEIVHSSKYAAKVLTFKVTKVRAAKDRVSISISNIEPTDWAELQTKFLFLQKDSIDKIATDRGDLLQGEKLAGRIFVKGVFVQYDSRFVYGYNFKHAAIDRDRKMIASWDLNYETTMIWNGAAAMRPDMQPVLFDLTSKAAVDVEGFADNPMRLDVSVRKMITDQFTAQFNEPVIPVATLAESREVEHLGRRGVVVNRVLGAVLSTTLGTKEDLLTAARNEVTSTLSWRDLSSDQQNTLQDNIDLIQRATGVHTGLFDLVDIVTFRSEGLLGMYRKGRVLIAARLLDDRDEMLATLIHEIAHMGGDGDGDKLHVQAIEDIWRDVVKVLR